MNVSWLEDFLALAESGNFSRAAEQRHMTQPAFSRRVRMLEDWLGVALVDRSRQPAELTEAGRWFRGVARETLARLQQLPEQARAVADAGAATLRFAVTHALSLHFLPDWLRGLEERLSLGPIQFVSDVAQRCETLLDEGGVHFLLGHAHRAVRERVDARRYRALRVGRDALWAVSAPDAEGRPRHALPALGGSLAGVSLLAYSAESGLGRIVREVLGMPAGEGPVVMAHLGSVLKSMALAGRGLAWLPRSTIGAELRAGTLLEAGDPAWRIDVDIVLYGAHVPQTAAVAAFWQAAEGVERGG